MYFDQILCGYLIDDNVRYIFEYTDEYFSNKNNKPISLTLPLNKQRYVSKQLFSFFDGLIPEGYLLDVALKRYDLDETDRFTLLTLLCNDTIGVASIRGIEDEK